MFFLSQGSGAPDPARSVTAHPMKIKHALALIICCLAAGCATRQAYTGDGMSEERFRFLYPREHYNSVDSSQQRELEQQSLREQAEWQRK